MANGNSGKPSLMRFLRYMTYSIQYYFLLKFYGIHPPLLLGLAGIATIFFVQASIPFASSRRAFGEG